MTRPIMKCLIVGLDDVLIFDNWIGKCGTEKIMKCLYYECSCYKEVVSCENWLECFKEGLEVSQDTVSSQNEKIRKRNLLIKQLRERIKNLKDAVTLGLREDQIANAE